MAAPLRRLARGIGHAGIGSGMTVAAPISAAAAAAKADKKVVVALAAAAVNNGISSGFGSATKTMIGATASAAAAEGSSPWKALTAFAAASTPRKLVLNTEKGFYNSLGRKSTYLHLFSSSYGSKLPVPTSVKGFYNSLVRKSTHLHLVSSSYGSKLPVPTSVMGIFRPYLGSRMMTTDSEGFVKEVMLMSPGIVKWFIEHYKKMGTQAKAYVIMSMVGITAAGFINHEFMLMKEKNKAMIDNAEAKFLMLEERIEAKMSLLEERVVSRLFQQIARSDQEIAKSSQFRADCAEKYLQECIMSHHDQPNSLVVIDLVTLGSNADRVESGAAAARGENGGCCTPAAAREENGGCSTSTPAATEENAGCKCGSDCKHDSCTCDGK